MQHQKLWFTKIHPTGLPSVTTTIYCILAIEPLAMAVRGTSGVTAGGREHRISLFPDDIIVFLRNLKQSIPNWLRLVKNFRSFSG